MFTTNDLTRYHPENPPYGPQAAYLRDSEGRDWYDLQAFFKEDTWKVGYGKNGVIVTAAKDVSAMFPEGLSLSEVEKVPEGFSVDMTWEYKDGEVSKIPVDQKKLNQEKKDSEMAFAKGKISDYQILVDLQIADEEDLKNLNAWKVYFAKVFKLDVSKEITWPVRP